MSVFAYIVVESTTHVIDRLVICVKNGYNMRQELTEGWSGVRISVWKRDCSLLQTVQPGSGAHPASYLMGTGVLSRG